MKDIKCPYCEEEQDINHDDNYGYEEDQLHEQICVECEKTFVFTTSIHLYYEATKADCLNGEDHKYKPTMTVPRRYIKMKCIDCNHERIPTDEEIKNILNK